MDAINSGGGSSIVDLMAMLRQLYTQSAAPANGSAAGGNAATGSTASQNAATAIGIANAINASGVVGGSSLSDDSLLTLLQTQSVTDPSTTTVTGQVTNKNLASWFSAADKDHSGTISKSEFENARPANITADQAGQLFDSIDTQKTGSLSATQLQQGLATAIQAAPSSQNIGGTNQLFNQLDTDGDGHLTKAEFEQDRGSGVTLAQADAVFDKLDPTGSGSITAAQFGQALVDNSVGANAATGSARRTCPPSTRRPRRAICRCCRAAIRAIRAPCSTAASTTS